MVTIEFNRFFNKQVKMALNCSIFIEKKRLFSYNILNKLIMSAVRKIQSPSKKDKRSMQPLLK